MTCEYNSLSVQYIVPLFYRLIKNYEATIGIKGFYFDVHIMILMKQISKYVLARNTNNFTILSKRIKEKRTSEMCKDTAMLLSGYFLRDCNIFR